MCAEDVIHGRRRWTRVSSIVLATGENKQVLGADARRVGVMFSCTPQAITQPQTAGIGMIAMDGAVPNVVQFYFTLYKSDFRFRVEEHGTLVTSAWNAVSGDANTMRIVAIEILTSETDAQLRGP